MHTLPMTEPMRSCGHTSLIMIGNGTSSTSLKERFIALVLLNVTKKCQAGKDDQCTEASTCDKRVSTFRVFATGNPHLLSLSWDGHSIDTLNVRGLLTITGISDRLSTHDKTLVYLPTLQALFDMLFDTA